MLDTQQKELTTNSLPKESVPNIKSSSSSKIKLKFTKLISTKKGQNKPLNRERITVKSLFSRTKKNCREDQPSSRSPKSSPPVTHRNNKVTPRSSVTSFCYGDSPRKPRKTTNNNDVVSKSPGKKKIIFYSERQSHVVNGIPSVPPCTPG